ncbi:MAG: phosphonopyruvate decarboxylase [Ignavibacteria bacterium]|nr:phosphonopyruvate decarboxylase [Ignavibacteria bacterium]
MISPGKFFEILKSNGINFYTGVPDSLLKDFCAYVTDNVPKENHIINSNEGAAVALASGHYLASGNPALVYMQNSGTGNAVNPLLSLADTEVYSIPMVLLIGWRGEPGKKDEPQHVKQGRVMLKMLEAMEIPYEILYGSSDNIESIIENTFAVMRENNCPVALIAPDGTFEEYKFRNDIKSDYPMKREDAVKIILDRLNEGDIVLSTTGKTSREVFEYRENKDQSHQNDFLTVGSMGHCSQIALGIALEKKDKEVYVIDGDGAVLMHMGALAIIGSNAPENFRHIIINNGAHDSVGGQPTAGFGINFADIAKDCGYKFTLTAEDKDQLKEKLEIIKHSKGPSLLEVRVNKGSRKDLGRPDKTPAENKKSFMEFLLR